MIKRLFSIVVLIFLAASCSNTIDNENALRMRAGMDDDVVFYATVEGSDEDGGGAAPDTKVFADAKMRVLWNEGDMISIFNKNTFNQPFQFKGKDGDNAGSFKKIKIDDFVTGNDYSDIVSVYPYWESTSMSNDGVLSLDLPATQTYKEQSFGIGANTMVSVTNDTFLRFKNVGSYLSFKFYGDGVSVKSIRLEGNNHEKLAGAAKVTMPLNGTPTTVMQEEATESITLTCTEPVAISADKDNPTEFYFVLPPTDFTKGITVTVTDTQGGAFVMNSAAHLTFERNKLTRLSAKKVIPDYDHTFVPFEDANFKAYCVRQFDKNGDGEISISEAQDITSITICTDNISSLKGMEFMGSLISLVCTGSRYDAHSGHLTALDISKNPAIAYVECSGNNISGLDLSHNANLRHISCGFNKLTAMDVSHNASLEALRFGYNQITALDISKNQALKVLDCVHNSLTSLDLTKSPLLERLDCGYNNLTALNISNNTELYYLTCYSCGLTTLDLSHNSALTELSCNSNQLTSLDVSNNVKLYRLDCSGNNDLTVLWLRYGQRISTLTKGSVTTIKYKGTEEEKKAKEKLDYSKRLWMCDRDSVAMLYAYKDAGNPVADAYYPLNTALHDLKDRNQAAKEAGYKLLKASADLIETFNGIIPHTAMSVPDSMSICEVLVAFARARQEYLDYTPYSSQPAKKYDNKNLFYYAFSTAPVLLVDSISFSDITFERIRTVPYYEYDVDGHQVGRYSKALVNIAGQLCGPTFANAIDAMGDGNNPYYPLSITDLNTTGLYGLYQLVPNDPPAIQNLDRSEYVPKVLVEARALVAKAVDGLNALWKRFWGDDLGAGSDAAGKVTLPELDGRYDPRNYSQEMFTEPDYLVSFSGDNIVWTSDLGTALGAADPNRSDAAGQSFNNNGLVHTYATSPTGYSAIFFGRKQPTDFYHYMKAQYDMNVLIQGRE